MKKRTIFDLIFIFLLLLLLIFLGTRDYSSKIKEDNKKFDQEYSLVNEENVFSYIKEEEAYENMQKDGIFFLGFSKNEWSNYYAQIINDAAKEEGIEKIYYYDFLTDREKASLTYKKIVSFLKDYLKKDDQENLNIYAPCLVIIKEGKIIFYDDETSFVTGDIKPASYWTEEKKQTKKIQFQEAFKLYIGGNVDGGEN